MNHDKMKNEHFDKQNDSELVQSVLTGDLRSFDAIVERYKDLVFSVTMNIVRNYDVAEDIAQETFMDCYLGLANLKDADKLYAWLYGIAKRKSLHFVSRNHIHVDIDEYSENLLADGSPELMFIQKEASEAVKSAVFRLSEKNRKVIEMFYFQEMSVSSIAEALGLTMGTVKSRLHEARNKLKGELSYMNTEKIMVSENFNEKVAKAIQKLRYYYVLNGGLELAAMKKNYLGECSLDSDIYIAQADKCCIEWNVDAAIENLQKAVRTNSTQETVLTALGGIDYLKRFKEALEKGYRICPSTYNTSYLKMNEKENRCYFDEAVYSFGPYRFGTRFEENRIFGVKIFRYLQDTVGCLFDYKRWSDGYTKIFKCPEHNELTVTLAVEHIDTVTTKLEKFSDCLKFNEKKCIIFWVFDE